MSAKYDVVIGLEIHAQLKTQSKCFSAASAEFGGGHNEHISLVCGGLPGALPSLNQKAVTMGIMTGLVLNCDIQRMSRFDRKQYFYPDMPKGYQISQMDFPIALNGYVEFFLGEEKRRVNLERAHMEEDAGKSTHHGEFSLINLNRAGVPLMEIVSRPEINSPAEAAAYARAVRQNLRYADICDGNLEEGSLRCDCNISLKPSGSDKLGTKVEIKNINSFRFIEKALEYEVVRQTQMLDMGETIVQETRLYDSTKNKTFSMRTKEDANDYRYFPDADLMPLIIEADQIEEISAKLPEMPLARHERYQADFGLAHDDAVLLVSEKELANFFEDLAKQVGDPKMSCNWMTGEFLRLFNASTADWDSLPVSAEAFAELLGLVKSKKISGKIGKEVFEEMWQSQRSATEIVKEKGLEQVSDPSQLIPVIEEILKNNPKNVAEYQSGKEKLFGFFVGQVMKATKGQADPALVNKLIKERLKP